MKLTIGIPVIALSLISGGCASTHPTPNQMQSPENNRLEQNTDNEPFLNPGPAGIAVDAFLEFLQPGDFHWFGSNTND